VRLRFFPEDFIDFLIGFLHDTSDSTHLFTVHSTGSPTHKPTQVVNFAHNITKLVMEFSTPGSPDVAHMTPDIIDGLRLIVQKLQPFISDRINFFSILLLGCDIAHIFEILEGWIDNPWARRVKAVELVLQFPDDFVPMAGLVLEQIKDQILEFSFMKHPFLSPMPKKMFVKHGNLLLTY
jgi:hypothetical protein